MSYSRYRWESLVELTGLRVSAFPLVGFALKSLAGVGRVRMILRNLDKESR